VPLLLDTSVVVAAERSTVDLAVHTAGRNDPVFLSVVSASELLHGVHRADSAERRALRSAFVERVLATIPVLEIDLGVARTHARLWADLAPRGALIGGHDLWIAASAITAGCAIATTNPDVYRRVPGLTVESWAPAPQARTPEGAAIDRPRPRRRNAPPSDRSS
jgi:tRNA(fMet)-specific endonuclease VapC